MNKKVTFILIISIVLIGIVILIASFSRNRNQFLPSFGTTPTPISLPPNTSSFGLTLVSTDPKDQSINVDVNQKITVTFNKLVTSQDVTIAFEPNIPHTTDFAGNTIIITPSNPFDPGTAYYYTIQFSDGVFTQPYSFTTAGNGPVTTPGYDNTANLNNAWSKQFQPDVYLANNTPYTGDTFSVTYGFTQTPQEHYFFTVLLNGTDKNQSKQAFLEWLHSLDITDQQIQTLDIRYF